MKTIYKYNLQPLTINEVNIHRDAEILDVQVQFNDICIWALLDPEKEKEYKRIAIYGTGHPIFEYIKQYIGTVQMSEGNLIFHVFEIDD